MASNKNCHPERTHITSSMFSGALSGVRSGMVMAHTNDEPINPVRENGSPIMRDRLLIFAFNLTKSSKVMENGADVPVDTVPSLCRRSDGGGASHDKAIARLS